MVKHFTDPRSNPNDQIANVVEVIGKSKDRKKVFFQIYHGQKMVKTVEEISQKTGLSKKRVLEEGVKLAKNHFVIQIKVNGRVAYEKDSFFAARKNKILSLVENPKKLTDLPTKTRPKIDLKTQIVFNFPKNRVKAKQITIDDIDSFQNVKKVEFDQDPPKTPLLEAKFKSGIKKILKEKSSFKDWGGEKNDLLSCKVKFKGKRILTAFAFKGRGTKGKLTLAKMGKNGDQIPRLFQCSAELFIVQYWGEIDQSVIDQVNTYAQIKSLLENKNIYYCIIHGDDTNRLIEAYSKHFPKILKK